MIVNPAHITLLQGGYKGYAVLGVGQGRNQRFGLIDRNGEIIIHPEFPGSYIDDGSRYVEFFTTRSYMRPRYYDLVAERWINHDDKHLIWPISGSAGRYFRIFTRRRSGIIDHTGRQILPMKYGYVGWCGGNFIVQNPRSGLFGIVTPDGEEVVPFSRKYEKVVPGDLDEPTLVEEDSKWFHIDCQGEIIASKGMPELPTKVASIYSTKQCIIYSIEREGIIKCGMLDGNGHEIIPPIYNNIFTFNGKYVKTCMYDSLKDGLKEGLKDLSGNTFFPTEGHRTLNPISGDDNLIIVGVPNHTNPTYSDCGIVRVGPDRTIAEVIPLRYTIPDFNGQGPGWIVAAEREFTRGRTKPTFRYGIFSLDGQLIVPFEYDDIHAGDDPERIAVCKDGKWFFINLKNERTLF